MKVRNLDYMAIHCFLEPGTIVIHSSSLCSQLHIP